LTTWRLDDLTTWRLDDLTTWRLDDLTTWRLDRCIVNLVNLPNYRIVDIPLKYSLYDMGANTRSISRCLSCKTSPSNLMKRSSVKRTAPIWDLSEIRTDGVYIRGWNTHTRMEYTYADGIHIRRCNTRIGHISPTIAQKRFAVLAFEVWLYDLTLKFG